jgi:hypothetical protein
MSLLEGVAARDEQIQEGLLKLQRSLSRQSFRGAESARRLVRRLGRKLQQNAEAVSMLYARTTDPCSAQQIQVSQGKMDRFPVRQASSGSTHPTAPTE